MDVLEEHGMNTIENREFREFEAGIRHVQQNPAAYVIKPLGEVLNVKRLLYVGRDDDGSDVVDVLRTYEKAWGHRMKGFQLQWKVEGVEVAVSGFFDDERTYDENLRNAAVVFEREVQPKGAPRDDRTASEASREAPDGIHIEDAKNVEGQWRVAGGNGLPIVVTGKGETMREAREQCYGRVEDIVIPIHVLPRRRRRAVDQGRRRPPAGLGLPRPRAVRRPMS